MLIYRLKGEPLKLVHHAMHSHKNIKSRRESKKKFFKSRNNFDGK